VFVRRHAAIRDILRALALSGYTANVQPPIDTDRFPEWQPFLDAVQQRRPDAGTWCEAWTVRDIVIHQAGNAEELARVLGAHLEGEPVSTRGFEEREGPLRALTTPTYGTRWLTGWPP
jgi:Mycothiol maleylpyruvate isomerase N-terminal domain